MRTTTALRCDTGSAPRFSTRLVEMNAGTVEVIVTGDVDLATEGLFAWVVEEAAVGAPTAVVVDLTRVDFLSLSAVTALTRARASAAAAGVALDVRVRRGIAHRALRLVGWPGVVGSATL
jgi:anti-anti-sigma factor